MSSGLFVFWLFVILLIVAGYPFAKAGLIHVSARIVKLPNRSYWRALFSVLTGVGVAMAIQIVAFGIAMRASEGFEMDGIAAANMLGAIIGIPIAFLVETTALALFLKTSFWRSLGAVALSYVIGVAALASLFLVIVIVFFFVGLATG